MKKWPNFFIVGAARCGSSSLYEYLKSTQGVYMSPVEEPNYFSVSVNKDLVFLGAIRDKKKYLELFKDVKDEIAIGEATPSYLWDPKTPKLIHDRIPKAKIIILLRDPIERAYSHFLKVVSTGYDSHPFLDSIKRSLYTPPDYSGRVVEGGLYYEQVKRYLDIFGKDQVRIYISEEFFADTRKTVVDVLDFLGVDSEPPESLDKIYSSTREPRGKISAKIIKSGTMRKIGRKIIPRSTAPTIISIFGKKTKKSPMREEAKKLLKEIYKDDVKKLENLLGRSLPWDIAKKP